MEEITLQALLEAGCHFGHKAERWHPKASKYIYTKKDGIHIIDLAQTKLGLEAAVGYVKSVVAQGGEVLFVGTKRQAQGVVKEVAENAGAPYFVERWIGGFMTNWDQIRKNIEKINRMEEERANDTWKKFPKHERTKMSHYLDRIKIYYGGVLKIAAVPTALFVVDVKKEIAAVREAQRRGVPVVGIVDTNSDPTGIDFVIPANDDAVGSVSYIAHVMGAAYKEGKDLRQKQVQEEAAKANEKLAVDTVEPKKAVTPTKPEAPPKAEVKKEEKPKRARLAEAPAKRGRQKKTVS